MHPPADAASPGPLVVWGTAHLYGAVDVGRSHQLLEAAWAAGVRRFDTAPSYGHGRSEAELGAAVRGVRDECFVTTKVGLAPAPAPGRLTGAAKAAARRLPAAMQDRVRGAGASGPPGDFSPDHVRRSVEASVARLGRVDRLMLHEVHPEQVTNELLDLLRSWLDAGVVGQLGVATRNGLTGPAVARAPDLLTASHTEVGPLARPVAGPEARDRVGHGVLGPAGSHLARLTAARDGDVTLRNRWAHAADATPFAGPDGLARALLVRGTRVGATELLLATSRPERVAPTAALLARPPALPAALAALVKDLVAAAGGRRDG